MGDTGGALDDAIWRSLFWALAGNVDSYVGCIDRQRRVLDLRRSLARAVPNAVGKGADELLTPLERAPTGDTIERAFASHEPQRVEHTATLADGRRLRLLTRVVPFRAPRGEELALQITTDITDRRQPARELETSAAFQRRVIENLPDFVAVMDRQHRFVWLNRIVPSLEPVIGRTLAAFVSAAGAHEAHAAIDAAFASKTTQHYEIEGPTGEGTLAWYAVRVVPLMADEVVEHVLLITTDVTQRRQAAQALLEKEEQLHRAQQLESLGQLAGGIAHDFNNLLQAIEGNLSFVKEGLQKGELPIGDLEQAMRATERAGELTSRLLAIGRRSRVAPQRVELGALVEQTVRMLRRVIPENVRLSYELPPTQLLVSLDPASFEQLLINLCVNARDAMPQGGSVKISLSADESEHVVMLVSDSGGGIAKENLSRVFEPFFTTKGAGSGLGLAVAAGIMQAHGGEITAHSDGRTGTTMKLRWPRVLDAGTENEAPSERVAHGSGVILVAEDEELVRTQVVRMLSRAGYSILQASNGAIAVEMFRQHATTIDLVLLDVVMPELDGWRAYQQILEIRPTVRVLFTTGYAANVLPPDFAARGARLLSKPYRRQQLLAEVQDLLDPFGPAEPD